MGKKRAYEFIIECRGRERSLPRQKSIRNSFTFRSEVNLAYKFDRLISDHTKNIIFCTYP